MAGMCRRTSSWSRSEEHTSELQSHSDLVCRLLLEKKKQHAGQGGGKPAPEGGPPDARTRPAFGRDGGRRNRLRRPRPHAARLPARLFFFNDTATTEIYTLSLHDALPI